MKHFFETILVAFGMFSRIPVPQVEWNEKNRKYSMLAFPLVGLVLGLCWVIVAALCRQFGLPELLTGALLTALPVLVVGGIHLDGYADAVDALSSHGDKEKKLAIMKDPHVGSFAVIHLVVCFLLWFAACTVLAEKSLEEWLLVGLTFVLSRSLSGLAVTTFPMAKDTGLAKSFADDADKKSVRNGLAVVLVLLVLLFMAMDIVDPSGTGTSPRNTSRASTATSPAGSSASVKSGCSWRSPSRRLCRKEARYGIVHWPALQRETCGGERVCGSGRNTTVGPPGL